MLRNNADAHISSLGEIRARNIQLLTQSDQG